MKLEQALKTGTLVEIEYTNNDGVTIKMNTLVDFAIKDGFFTIYAPMIKGNVYPMRENDTLWLMFMIDSADQNDKDIYKIKCRVEQRGYTNGIAIYKLFQMTEPEKIQRRGAFRLDLLKEYTIAIGEEQRLVTITTNNISSTGLKAMITEKIETNTIVILNLDTDLETLRIPSKVIMCNKLPESISKFDLRLQFLIEQESISQKVNAFLFKKQSEWIQKKNADAGFRDLYYKLYESEPIDPELEAVSKQTSMFVLLSVILAFIATAAIFVAVPKDPQIIFKTLIKTNIVYGNWDYNALTVGVIFSGINTVFSGISLLIKRRYRLANQLPINPMLTFMTIYSFGLFVYSITHF